MSENRGASNVQVGYQVAADLWVYEGSVSWSAFNAMLVANSVLFSGAVLLLAERWPSWPLHIGGLVLCRIWRQIALRFAAIHDYRVSSTRELEEQLEGVATVSRGAQYHKGEQVELLLGGETKRLVIPCTARTGTGRLMLEAIDVFTVLNWVGIVVSGSMTLLWLARRLT